MSSRTRIERLLEAVPDALVGMDQKGVIQFVNHQSESLFGYDRDQLIGQPIEVLVPEPLWQIYAEHREDYFSDPRARSSGLELELVGRQRDGTEFPINISMSHIDTGDVLLVITAARDVAQRQRAVKSAELTEAIVEYSDDAIMSLSLSGIVGSWNPAAERMYGYSSQEMIGRSGSLLTPRARTGELPGILARIKEGQEVEHSETTLVRKDGTTVPVWITTAPIRDANGTVVGASAVHRDVTVQRQALEVAQRMAAIVEGSDDAIIGSTLEGIITSWNTAAERLFGYSSQEIVGTSAAAVSPRDRPDEMKDLLARVRAGQHIEHLETIRIRKDGTAFPVSLTVSPIRDADGGIVGSSMISRDMTELKHAARYARSLIEADPDPLVTISPEGKITDVNQATVQATGVPRNQLVGTDFSGYFTDPDKAHEVYQRVFAKGSVADYPLTLRHLDGTLTDVLYNASVYRDFNEEIVGVFAAARDVTEQKKAFEASQLAATIVKSSNDAIIGSTLEGTVTSWNPAAERMFGWSGMEIIGRSATVLGPQDRTTEIRDIMARVSAGQPVEALETFRIRRDGTVFPVSLAVSPILVDGVVTGASAICRDITEREQAARYARSLIETALDPLVTISPEGKITDVNQAAAKATGVPRDKLIGTDFSGYFTDPDKAHKGYERVFTQGSVTDYPLTLRHQDGTLKDVRYNASVYRDPCGNVLGVFAAARDVTEQKRASRYARSLLETAPDPLVTIGPEGVITDVNQATVQATGVPRDKLIGTDFSHYFTDPDKADQGYQRVFTQGSVTDYPLTLRHRDGNPIDVLYNASVYRDTSGNVLGVFAAARDVSEQKKAFEDAQRATTIIENADDAIISGSLDGRITSWNPAAERMYGYSCAEIIGKSATFLTPKDRTGEIQTVLTRIKAGERVRDLETKRIRKDGTVFPVALTVSPVRDVGGAVVGTSVIHRDLSNEKGALAVAQRMAAIVEYSDDAIIGRTIDGIVTSWNPAAERMFGYSGTEIVGKSADLLIPGDRAGERISTLAKISAGAVIDNLETIRLHKDGTAIPVSLTISPIRDEKGAVVSASMICRDISDLKHAVRYTRSLIEAALDPLVTISPEGKITDVNEAMVKVTGVPRNKLIGTDFSQYSTDPDKADEGYQRVFAQGSVTDYPLTLRHRDGTLTDFLYNASVYRDTSGAVLGVFAAARDMTSQKEGFEAAQRVAAIVDYADEAIVSMTLDGTVTTWNPAAERMFGYAGKEIAGKSVSLLSPADRKDEIKTILAKVGAGGSVKDFETICTRQDGSTFPVKLTVTPIRAPGGTVVGASAIARDVYAVARDTTMHK